MPEDGSSSGPEPPGPVRTRILKFGGSSLDDPARIESVADLIVEAAEREPIVVVVSALGGVTDALSGAARRAEAAEAYDEELTALRARHQQAAEAVAPETEQRALAEFFDVLLDDVRDLLRGVRLVKECSPRTWDQILSFGERLSAPLVASGVRRRGLEAEACDARSLILTDRSFGGAWVNLDETSERVRGHFQDAGPVQIVTGFIASTARGETTTLGRSGSDYTATLLAAALDASEVEIWTDVDGVMSADPRLVPEAFSLEALSYEELMELSHWGARVMHPASVRPARQARVPIVIRNTMNPTFPGTRVVHDPPTRGRHPVRGIASVHHVALLRLEGAGMQGVPGVAQRLFGSLAQERISVILITQASSERSICFAIGPADLERALEVLDAEFRLERQAGLVDPAQVEEPCSVVAAVGEGMRETPGISGRVFGVLGHHRINVRAIAQGSSELNISLVVAQEDEERALRAIHDAFFADRGAARLFLAGVGKVGTALLEQLRTQEPSLSERGVDLRLVGLSRSTAAALDPDGISLDGWEDALARDGRTFEDMLRAALESDHPHRIFVDCTASAEVGARYEELLADGVSVVAANKLAFSDSSERFRGLQALGERGMGLYFETTVGAGLPILRTVADLVATGDRIHRLEGLLSGTLGFVFHRFGAGARFSEALTEAREAGFTEPDPREDLGGADVARKLTILGRVGGWPLETRDVRVEPLLPDPSWTDGEVDRFWQRLPELDDHFEALRDDADREGGALRYLGTLEPECAVVGLQVVDPDHPCHRLGGSDNLVAITTDRYSDTPLVVRGPGAGPDVTAAGVFSDVLRALAEAS